MIEFINNYPQKEIGNEQKQNLFNLKQEDDSFELLIKILFDILLMINFYNEGPIYSDKDLKISETILDFPHYFKIKENTKRLFQNNSFTMSQIILVYEYLELLCFKAFKENINQSYKIVLDNEKKNNINKYFSDNPNAL